MYENHERRPCTFDLVTMIFNVDLEIMKALHICGDVVAEWVACGTLNVQVMGSNLSAAS